MKKIRKKTEEEQQETVSFTRVPVGSLRHFYWACDACNTAYFAGDEIIQSSDGKYFCPRKVSRFFGNGNCNNRIYGGDEECFNEYYKLV